METASLSRLVRFGTFELDLRSGELRRAGARIQLAEQPFRVLSCLIQHAGDVVTREELRHELWPSDTFVDFEHGLNVAIRRVRDALGDDADAPRFVETLPKRGYRFIAPVSRENVASDGTTGGAEGVSVRDRRRTMAWASGAVLTVMAAGGALFLQRPAPILTDRDTILIEDFVSRSGDEVLDDTLRQGLIVQLEQSPFFAVISRERVRQALRQMTRSPDEDVAGEVAREICQRVGAKVSVGGRIAMVGQEFVIGLEAVDCASGDTVAIEQAQASSHERLLAALGSAASSLRQRLGESVPSIQKYAVPMVPATTPSLEAAKLFSSARAERDKGHHAAAVPLLERAVEIDPEFALAWAHLSAVLLGVGRRAEADDALFRAYARRDRVPEQERYYISHRYYVLTGEVPRNAENSEIWAKVYPRDWLPHDNLCKLYWQLWNPERALAECREARRLAPQNIYPYDGLVAFNLALGRTNDARAAASGLLATRLNDALAHSYLARVSWIEEDSGALDYELTWLRGNAAAEYKDLRRQRSMAAGRLREAVEFGPVSPAVFAFVGRLDEARERAESMLRVWHAGPASSHPPADALLTMGLAGDALWVDRAEEAARALPNHLILNHVIMPSTHAALALARGNGRRAVERLEPARPYGFSLLSFTPTYVRGLAFLQAKQAREAAVEFEQIIAHRGVDPGSVLWPLAHLGLARAGALAGDTPASLRAYERFLTIWSQADMNLPVLQQARAEYERLQTVHGKH